MTNKWSFKIEFKNPSVWENLKKESSLDVPEEFKEFITRYNAACPSDNLIRVNGVERVCNSMLSFNQSEADAATFLPVYQAIGKKDLVPFAGDPFGNYFCYSLSSKKISFYHHEVDELEETNYTLEQFITSLYK